MWRAAVALVLVLSFSLVIVAPAAATVSSVTVTPVPSSAGQAAEYTVVFTTTQDMAQSSDDDIRIEFPVGTTVPGSYTNDSISINGTDVDDTVALVPTVNVDIVGRQFIIDVPEDVATGTVTVVFKEAAGIENPLTEGLYTLQVHTSREVTPVDSLEYDITGPMGPADLYRKHVAECGEIEGDIDYEFVESYDTIQEALDVADYLFWEENAWYGYAEMPEYCNYVGARVEVHPGTYYETIVIDTPFVEVVGIGGSDVTTIDAAGLPPSNSSYPAAVAITAGGVTFDDFTVINAGVGVDADLPTPDYWPDVDGDDIADIKGILVYMDSEKNSALIYNALGGPIDIMNGTADKARVNIVNNEVYDSTAHGIAVWSACVLVTGNDVYNNQFDGFFGWDLYNGVETCDPPSFTPNPEQPYACTEINENTFADNGEGRNELDAAYGYAYESTDNGIQIMSAEFNDWCDWWDGPEPPGTIYIVGNEIYRNSNAGIYLGDGIYDTVVIKFNQIEDNDVFGISSHMDDPYRIVCIYNDIAGNGVWGIKNWEEEEMLIATLNYFGDLSGPSCGPAPVCDENDQQSLALGSGDAVSHFVEYKWWLTSSFEDVQADLVRYYGSDCYDSGFSFQTTPIVPLETGWNTMSTPVALDERADEMGEIVALGGWMQNYVIGYSYDPVGGWQLLTGDFQLLPLEAVYVRMAGPDTLPILLKTTNYMPARDLEPGWNLVGPNFGFWSMGQWSETVDYTLSSIAGSWGVAISPSMPGQQDAWVCTPADASYNMSVGDGYWVFVTQPTTLAGFRMAPWYLEGWEIDILACQLPPWMQH